MNQQEVRLDLLKYFLDEGDSFDEALIKADKGIKWIEGGKIALTASVTAS